MSISHELIHIIQVPIFEVFSIYTEIIYEFIYTLCKISVFKYNFPFP